MTQGQCNQITNDAPKMSSLFPCTCYIIVFRVGIKGNNSTNTFPPYKQKPQGTKDVRIKCMFFFYIFHTYMNYRYINVSVYMYK